MGLGPQYRIFFFWKIEMSKPLVSSHTEFQVEANFQFTEIQGAYLYIFIWYSQTTAAVILTGSVKRRPLPLSPWCGLDPSVKVVSRNAKLPHDVAFECFSEAELAAGQKISVPTSPDRSPILCGTISLETSTCRRQSSWHRFASTLFLGTAEARAGSFPQDFKCLNESSHTTTHVCKPNQVSSVDMVGECWSIIYVTSRDLRLSLPRLGNGFTISRLYWLLTCRTESWDSGAWRLEPWCEYGQALRGRLLYICILSFWHVYGNMPKDLTDRFQLVSEECLVGLWHWQGLWAALSSVSPASSSATWIHLAHFASIYENIKRPKKK